jgi:hypothetical protein
MPNPTFVEDVVGISEGTRGANALFDGAGEP